MSEDTSSETASRQAIAKRSINVESKSATLDFPTLGKSITINFADLKESILVPAVLNAVVSSAVSAYSADREDPAKAYEAAAKRIAMIVGGVWPSRAEGSTALTALDVAILVRAEARGIDVEKVRSVVMGESEEFRRQFVSKVKGDPLTAGLFAAKRASKKPDAKLEDMGI